MESLDLDERLNRAVAALISAVEMDGGGIYLLEPDDRTPTLRSHAGHSERFVREMHRLQVGEGATGRAVAEGRPIALDIEHYQAARAEVVRAEGLLSMASAPIQGADRLVGGVVISSRRRRTFEPEGSICSRRSASSWR